VSDQQTTALTAKLLSELPSVAEMFADVAGGPAIMQPSEYWTHINAVNLKQLESDGFDRFKRSINQNYFAFVPTGAGDDQYDAVHAAWKTRPIPMALWPRTIDTTGLSTIFSDANPLGGPEQRRGHARYLAMLWEVVRRRDDLNLLTRLQEPELGSPITIQYRGRRISQDLCNSVNEFYAATETSVAAPPASAIELGGGYGRVAWVFLSQFPAIRYLMCDIPPALSIAQRYLTALFPTRRAFTFRQFDDYASIAEEFEAAQVAFVTPGQLDALPPQGADLFINISSLHEMRLDQIAHYFKLIQRHCEGCFYTKQWLESVNVRDGLVLRPEDYPVPEGWHEVYRRQHAIQTKFFEALYEMR